MAPALVALEAINLGGSEGGFVYAKVPVPLDEREIETRVKQVQALADASGVEILVVDFRCRRRTVDVLYALAKSF